MWQGSYFHKVLRTGVHNIMILLKRMGINRSAAVVRGPADDPRHRAGGGALRRRLSARPVPQDLHPPLREGLHPLRRHQGLYRWAYLTSDSEHKINLSDLKKQLKNDFATFSEGFVK